MERVEKAHVLTFPRRGKTLLSPGLEAGVDLFRLARVMGTSVAMIDRTYGHLSREHAVESDDVDRNLVAVTD